MPKRARARSWHRYCSCVQHTAWARFRPEFPMCSNYVAVTSTERLRMYFGVEAPPPTVKAEVWPVYEAPFIRRHPNKDVGDDAVPPREVKAGLFGMIPHWAGELSFGRRTYNASGALLTVRSGKSACSHDLVTVSCGSGRSDCLNWRQRPSAEVRQGPVNDGSAAGAAGGDVQVIQWSLPHCRHTSPDNRSDWVSAIWSDADTLYRPT
jgi:hypothetical protein